MNLKNNLEILCKLVEKSINNDAFETLKKRIKYESSLKFANFKKGLDVKTNLNFEKYAKKKVFENLNSDLFEIVGLNSKIKIRCENNHLIIEEFDKKYLEKINNVYNYNNININNLINKICEIPIDFDINNIHFEFSPTHKNHTLTIHNGPHLVDHIMNINLFSFIGKPNVNILNSNVDLKYNRIKNKPDKYIIPKKIILITKMI